MDTDRNLLFGVLALQADLLDPARFVEACTLWANQKQTPLPDLLVQRGWLTLDDRADVERVLERKLKKLHGDARAGLAQVTTDQVRHSLAAVVDPDIRQSLAGLATPAAPGHVLLSTTAHLSESRDRYTLTRLHATGGLGRVWLAHDASLGRDVALKELRPERAGHPATGARFLKEAQITGQLEHPGVVPIYEVGKRPEDQSPFYTMRFVRGRTLAEASAAYHRRRQQGEAGPLELRELLGAFLGICNAVAYAHSRGVLHRDLKPQNVVLGDYGEVVLLDWGLAKLMSQTELDDADAVAPLPVTSPTEVDATVQGEVLGTPAYMAPEQAEGRLDLLGPATDVYGLGAILYEILTGKPPFTAADTTAVIRQVIHDAPARPRVVAVGAPAALEAICLKALAKKPAARYPTVKELGAEVQRWLADEPVSAYRDSVTVRLSRWARKHRNSVAIGAALLQTAVVVLAVSVLLIGRSRAQVDRERRRAEAVNAFLIKDLLAQADPKANPASANLTVRELLDRAAAAVQTSASMKENSAVEGAVRSTIGTTYYSLGLYQRAREELEQAAECQDRAPDVAASERLLTKNRLCWVVYKLGSFDETIARQLLAQCRQELGHDHEETVYAADNLATIAMGNGRMGEALPLLHENLATQQRVLGPEHPLTIRAALNLADALMSNYSGDMPENLAEAHSVMLATRDACHRALSPTDPEALAFENALGFLYAREGKFTAARQVLVPLRERLLRVLGPDHLDIARYQENLALAEEGLGHLDAAESLLQKSYAIRKSSMGDGHGLTRRAACYLGRVCLAQDKTDQAVAWYRVLMSAGVTRTGKGIAFPPTQPTRWPPGGADISHLGDAFSGKGDPKTNAHLLQELYDTVNWLSWRADWAQAYIWYLHTEAARPRGKIADEDAAQDLEDAIRDAKRAINVMEANPATPPRLLEKVRVQLKQLQKTDADRRRPR